MNTYSCMKIYIDKCKHAHAPDLEVSQLNQCENACRSNFNKGATRADCGDDLPYIYVYINIHTHV
jgi:hypothetical protein